MTDIYKENILEHNKNPRNFGSLKKPTHSGSINNPLCGDEIKIQLIINDMEEVKSVLNNRENLKKKDLEIHATQDRWMFGLVITLLICIFTKLIIS